MKKIKKNEKTHTFSASDIFIVGNFAIIFDIEFTPLISKTLTTLVFIIILEHIFVENSLNIWISSI